MKVAPDQFVKLALEQADVLYRIARRLARDPSAAEDLVQETYLRALRARDGFELQDYGIRPWLVRIMHNLHTSRSQREGRQPHAVEDEQLEQLSRRSLPAGGALGVAGGMGQGAADGKGSGPPGVAAFEGMDEQLVRAVDSLPPEYSTVLLLWALDDLSYKEIAEAVGVPIGTVMSRLHRARQRLSDQLRDHATREGMIPRG